MGGIESYENKDYTYMKGAESYLNSSSIMNTHTIIYNGRILRRDLNDPKERHDETGCIEYISSTGRPITIDEFNRRSIVLNQKE